MVDRDSATWGKR